MPTMDEYARSGGYTRDAQVARNVANMNTSSSSSSSSGGYMNIPKATAPAPAAPVAPTVDYNKMLAQALAKQQADAESARRAAEAAAAAKKQQYVDTQTGLYNNYFNDQQNSQLAALRNARETALQGYNGTERVAQQTAYNNSNQVDAQHTQSAQRLKEIMAANGLLSSGDNVTQNLQLENQRQNALYDINQSKGNLLQDIAEKRSLVNNQAASQEQGLANQISADKTRALIDLQQYGDQKETDLTKFNYGTYVDGINRAMQQQQFDTQTKLNEANLTGQYNGSQTLASLNSARQDALARAGLTGTLDGQQTMQLQNQGFNQMVGLAGLTGQLPNGAQTLAAQQFDRSLNQQNKIQNMDNYWKGIDRFGYGAPKEGGQEFANQYAGAQPLSFQTFLQSKEAQDAGFTGIYHGQPTMQKLAQDNSQSLQERRFGLDERQTNANIDNMNNDNTLNKDRFSWEKDPTNPDNMEKIARINALTTKGDQKLQDESKGLVEALRGSKMTPAQAIQQIDEDVQLGFYSADEAVHLKSIVTTISPNLPTPANQKQLTPEQQAAIPSNAELDKLYKEQGNGAPLLDWKSWYKDPQGKSAGVTFDAWKQLYGPKMGK